MGRSTRPALISVALATALYSSGASAQTSNCVITGGTNYGSITQSCVINPAPAPLSVISDKFETIAMPNGTYRQQIFVQMGGPSILATVACGDGVLDVGASPWPAGMTATSEKIINGNCVAYKYFNTAPGRWAMWVDTKAPDTKFELHPIIQ
jgi:hypothetical protein